MFFRSPARPPKSTSAITCRRTSRRSSGGSRAIPTPIAGGRSSATCCSAKAAPLPPRAGSSSARSVTRAKITRLLEVDIRSANPLGEEPKGQRYGTVISAYCADSATADRAIWEAYMRRIVELVRPGGTLITAALRHTHSYLIDGKPFPSPNIGEDDLRSVLEPWFDRENLESPSARCPSVRDRAIRASSLQRHIGGEPSRPPRPPLCSAGRRPKPDKPNKRDHIRAPVAGHDQALRRIAGRSRRRAGWGR